MSGSDAGVRACGLVELGTEGPEGDVVIEVVSATILKEELAMSVGQFATTVLGAEVLRLNAEPPVVCVADEKIGAIVRPVWRHLSERRPTLVLEVGLEPLLEFVL